ncbi:XylR family transcriptional regulator [Haloferula helveola]|uniref:XylR family transcriptional regulator n=1 Tax=Haloferula helveola TaxID=490095 RepID=A0ABN6HBE5_9BACT|nr:XylR family transcriptional regulator [Haloferula helveola]
MTAKKRPRAKLPQFDDGPSPDQPSILVAFDWFDHRIYKGIARFAVQAGWHLSPYLFSDRNVPFNWPGDGAITCYGPTLAPFIDSLTMPKVDVSVAKMPHTVPRVLNDNLLIGRLAAEHFLKRGFHHFAFFRWPAVEVNPIREASYRAALLESGVDKDHFHIIRQPGPKVLRDWAAHEKAILEQLEKLPRPLAVFTGQDNLGATLIEVCVRNGIHVPEEISVLGVDNIEFLCDCLAVPMSSVDTRLDELGYQAAKQLQRRMDGEIADDAPPLLIAPGRVVNRRSTEVLAVPHAGVAKALRLMRAAFSTPMTLEDVCEHVGMSKRGLEKAFRTHLQRSPAAELRRIRIDHAKRMLTETDIKIEAIARECGYCNSSNLSLAFKRDTKLSPRAYRRKFRTEEHPA